MKKSVLSIFFLVVACMISIAAEPDILVTQSGESLKVYNLEMSPTTVFYTLEEGADAGLQKIAKADVLIIKKADGTVVNFNNTVVAEPENKKSENPAAHAPVTFTAVEDSFIEEDVDWKKELDRQYLFYTFYKKNGGDKVGVTHERFILAGNKEGQVLNMRILSDKDKILAVARPQKVPKLDKNGNKEVDKNGKVKTKDGKYEMAEIIIPEYVMINGEKYSVTEIDPAVFMGHKNINNVIFPETLKSIDSGAFWGCSLKSIILPESLEKIGAGSFYASGDKMFKELYIPKGVKEIGAEAFHFLGPNRSYRGFYQGTLSCIPDFVSKGNCKDFGIDEEAVDAYERRK